MSFGLVLIGLALVSMCIQIIQSKIQHLFDQKLNAVAVKYQEALAKGEKGKRNRNELAGYKFQNIAFKAKAMNDRIIFQTCTHKFHFFVAPYVVGS